MAERRMIAKTIVDSDIFLDMPQSTQNLYFHLNIRADDDGFVNAPKKIMRTIGANQNDLEILLAKRYILSFESGVVVIKHWKLHNCIRKDRYKPTVYQDEKSMLTEKDNGAYTDCQPSDNQVTTDCQPSGCIGKVSIGKVSIGKDREVEKSRGKTEKHKYGEYKHVLLTDAQYKKLLEEWGDSTLEAMIKKLDEGIQMKGYKYKDHNLTIRNWYSKDNPSKLKKKIVDYAEGWE